MQVLRPSSSVALAAWLSASPALAQFDDEIVPYTTHDFRHDGLYVRVGAGAGYLLGKTSDDETSAPDRSIDGFAVPSELAVGGTVSPGIVIGAGSYGAFVPDPTHTTGRMVLSGVGPFIDDYFDPTRGLHVQAAVLFAYGELQETPKASGFGVGIMSGVGYDVWVSEQWSIGALARLAYYDTNLTFDVVDNPSAHFRGFLPGLLFTATYH